MLRLNYDDDTYIGEIVCSLTDRLASVDFEPEVIVASFHGMPLETQIKADRYHDQCHKTADLIRLRPGLPRNHLIVTFQSSAERSGETLRRGKGTRGKRH